MNNSLDILYIASKLSIDNFLTGDLNKEAILNNMARKKLLTDRISKAIYRMYNLIEANSLTPLISVRTPIKGSFGRKFNLVFDYENLEKLEEVSITIEYGIMFNLLLRKFPTGHHSILMVTQAEKSSLISKLNYDPNESIKIGICNKENWFEIKQEIINSRIEFK